MIKMVFNFFSSKLDENSATFLFIYFVMQSRKGARFDVEESRHNTWKNSQFMENNFTGLRMNLFLFQMNVELQAECKAFVAN